MINKSSKFALGLLVLSLASILVVDFAEARRGGGMRAGGMRAMRGGPAASGSFNRSIARPSRGSDFGRPARNPSRNPTYTRPSTDLSSTNIDRDRLDERVDNRQDYREERYDRVDDYYDDRRDWYEDRWRAGAYLSIAAWNRMSCPYTTVVIDSITYYECYDVRYERVYRGTEITYIIVD